MSIVPKDEALVFSEHPKFGAVYARNESSERTLLAQKLGALYESSRCLILPSGMSAISTALHAALTGPMAVQPVNFLYGHQLFSSTPKLFELLCSTVYKHVRLQSVDTTDVSAFERLMQTSHYHRAHNILFFESCSNPDGFVADPRLVSILRQHSETSFTIVDNTWLAAAIFNPLQAPMCADCVVVSLTKYYSAGHAIAGAVVYPDTSKGTKHSILKQQEQCLEKEAKQKQQQRPLLLKQQEQCLEKEAESKGCLARTKHSLECKDSDTRTSVKIKTECPSLDSCVKESKVSLFDSKTTCCPESIDTAWAAAQAWSILNGLHVSSVNCRAVLDHIDSLKVRVEKASATTVAVLRLASVDSIMHPSLMGHPSHQLATMLWNKSAGNLLWPSVLTFDVPIALKKLKPKLERQTLFEYKTSFGGARSRIDCFPKQITDSLTKLKSTRLRLSVGYDDSSAPQRFVEFLACLAGMKP